jgi:arginyl-tRNA--protein-N-Asp/Glu arginylyltransferase
VDVHLYSQLSELGFRRSGPHLYRPHCASCNACIPARIPVGRFQTNRQQKRIWQRNQDLRVEDRTSLHGDEFYDLYARYIEGRHRDGDMYPPTRQQFESFLTREWNITHYYCFYADTKLVAVAVVDVIESGLSAIYTFFDPDQSARSLGVYAVLWQIEMARRLDLPNVYLGYWIKQCRKMAYKINYRPVELLINGRWVSLN